MYAAAKVKGKGKRSKNARRRSIEEGIPDKPSLLDFEVAFHKDSKTEADLADEATGESTATASHDFEEEVECRDDLKNQSQELSEASVSFGEEVKAEECISNLPEALENLNIVASQQEIKEEVVVENDNVADVNFIATVPQISEYKKLAEEVKTFAQELNEPSAPLTCENVSPVSDHTNYIFSECLEEPLGNLKKCRELSDYSLSYTVEDVLTPLSDAELSEFYLNEELKQCNECIEEFLNQERNDGAKMQNYLYNLLVQYLKSRKNYKSNEIKIQGLDKDLDENIQAVWTIWNDVEVTETEKCKDGNNVVFVHRYMQARFNNDVMKRIKSTLSGMKRILYESLAMDSFSSLVARFKIECYLYSLMTSCPEFTNLAQNAPAKLQSGYSNLYFQQCVTDLKLAIGMLFLFQRKQKTDMDSVFQTETRQWLSDLVAILIRVGNWKDHIFILSHVIRCPGGVGQWAARFIQTPYHSPSLDPFSDPEINHIMTIMSVILQPIEKREEFLQDWSSVVMNEDHPWVVIDSDGEDDDSTDHTSCPLKENDLVLLLNQIPFSYLFKSILRFDNGELQTDCLTIEHLFKLFSFCTDFIKILHTGLQLYSTQRYKQFSKRLGRLIRHIVQYATDELIIFKSLKMISDEDLLRLQVEYDNFFLKSAKFIYSSQKHGAWQFLAVVPYNMASSGAILKLYGILQLGESAPNKLQINLLDFEEKFAELPESEQFYLLSTFTNMALARDLSEIDFIKTVLMQLFYVGFLGGLTKDQCYKNAKSLLFNICSTHPFLISEILNIQQEHFVIDPNRDQKLSIYLWMELPLKIWIPSCIDLDVISMWLMEPLGTVRNELSRIILRSLNYGGKQTDLFLHPAIHRNIANLILKANLKLVPDTEANMMRNVSNLVRSANTPQINFQQWSWNLLLRLKLHIFDQADEFIRKSFQNLPDELRKIPDLESEKELYQLVEKKNSIACFIALNTTTVGHSVPIIFDKGFNIVECLFNSGNYDAGIACIEYMTLMFIECGDLHKCEKFISILSQIIAADYSYLKMAKNLITNDFPGQILKSFENMIQNQLRKYGFMGFDNLIELWVLALTKIPLWTQEPGVVYLLDKILKNGFFDSNARGIIKNIFEDLLENSASPSETKSSFSSLVSWMNTTYTPPTLLPKGCNGEAPWFAYKIIEIEHEMYELKTSLWQELLKELFYSNDKKTNVDNSLKKACNVLQIPARPSSTLAIYKWVYQILETEVSHPIIILMWQKFFILYLNRVPGLVDRGSVGEKFFHGIVNQALLKRLKSRLKEIQEYYTSQCETSDPDDLKSEFYLKSSQLLQNFQLWLDEPRLHEQGLSIHLLPAQCNPQLLGLIIHGNTTPWIEYLNHDLIQEQNKNNITSWLKLKNRWEKSETLRYYSNSEEKKSPMERIQNRLGSYETPLAPPNLNLRKSILPPLSRDFLMRPRNMISFIQPSLKIIFDYTEQYIIQINEYAAIGCDIQDFLKKLYKTKQIKVTLHKKCNGFYKTRDDMKIHCECSGPATIIFRLEESELDQRAKEYLNQTIKQFNGNVQRATTPLQTDLGVSAVLIDNSIKELKKEYIQSINLSQDEKGIRNLKDTGVALFYYFVESWTENVSLTPAISKAFSDYVDELGKMFIMDNPEECVNFLKTIAKTPKLVLRLCDYFTPNVASIKDFIDMYAIVIDWNVELMYVMLSKFDLVKWLMEKKPKFAERSRLISLIGKGLKADGFGPSKNVEVRELLNYHLQILLLHDFPEHYGEILRFLLEASESQSISTSTWFTFLNALVPQGIVFVEGQNNEKLFEPGQSVKKLKLYFSKYATEQNLLSLADIKGTISLLASTFKTDRLKHGLYGLYPKYRRYIEPIFIFFGMLSHSCIAKSLQIDLGSLSDKIIEQLWPFICDLFSPWLIPYWTKNEKSQAAVWIQELTDDRCVLLPWIINDCIYASYCSNIFVESVRFILDTLPGVNSVLSYVWYFYVVNYAHAHVKDHVVGVIHRSLLSLPWNTFFPNLQDVELMLKVVDQFLPLCHCFLGSIFVEIKWTDLVQFYLTSYDVESNARLHICLLNLLVKLPSEPSLKQNKTVTTLLTEANGYAWHLVDSSSYDSVLNWFVMSCDPRIILMDERSEYYTLDSIILRLLQTCAGYTSTAKQFHPSTLTKRLMFIRASVKWLVTANSRFKCKQTSLFKSAICTICSDIEAIVTATVPVPQRIDETGVLLSEFMNIFKETDLAPVVEETMTHWLSTRRAGVVVYGLLKSAGFTIDDPNIFGNIIEACLENYFESTENCDWEEIISILAPFSSPNSCLEKYLINNNNLLTLYAILSKRFQRGGDDLEEKMMLSELFQILSNVKFSDAIEPKLVLLIIYMLKLIDKQAQHNRNEAISFLIRLTSVLNNFLSDKGSGILSTLGLKKSFLPSNRFKLICLAVNGGIMMVFKKSFADCQDKVDEKFLQNLDLLDSNKQFQNINNEAVYVKNIVKNVASLEEVIRFLNNVSAKLFNKLYLK